MTVGSELPHFIAMDNDILSTGVVIYHLQVVSLVVLIVIILDLLFQMGSTSIGTSGCDIGVCMCMQCVYCVVCVFVCVVYVCVCLYVYECV